MWRPALAGCFLCLASCYAASTGITYLRLLGSANIAAAAADAAGNVYLTGSTNDASFPVTAGALQAKFGGGTCVTYSGGGSNPGWGAQIPYYHPCNDAVVIKLDPAGNVVFATFLGGSGDDAGTGIAVDGAGNIYVAGSTSTAYASQPQNTFPLTPGAAFRDESPPFEDAFVAKLNPTGSALIYSTLIPGAAADGARPAVAADRQGNAYFSGVVYGSDAGPAAAKKHVFPTTSGAFQTSSAGGYTQAVVAKLNSTGSALVYGTYLGGSNGGSASDIAIDAGGHVYVTGRTDSVDFPTTSGAYMRTRPGNLFNTFVTKLNAAGSGLIFSTFLGGSGLDAGVAICLDADGNAYVLGMSNDTDFPITEGVFQALPQGRWGSQDGGLTSFVARLSPDGSALTYSTYFTGAQALDVDAEGNAWVVAQAGPGFPVTAGALQRCLAGGGTDAVVAQLNSQGALAAGTYLGGIGVDLPTAVMAVPGNLAVVAGTTSSPGFDAAEAVPGFPIPSAAFAVELQIADPNRKDTPCMARALQNASSYAEGAIAPGELVTLRGLGFGPETGVIAQTDPAGKIPTALTGVQVFFDDLPAPLLYVQAEQINVQAPFELAGKATTRVHTEYNGDATNAATIPIAPVAPAISYITNQDGTINSAANPAESGSVISIYGTGGGVSSPPAGSGEFAPLASLGFLTLPVAVTVEIPGPPTFTVIPSPATSISCDVLYAGSAPLQTSGIFQVNVRIPASLPAGPQMINMSVGNVNITNSVVTLMTK